MLGLLTGLTLKSMGSVDLVPYWQVIVVTLETVIAAIELAGIIMQVRTQTWTI
jgi:hypothetical protein